MKIIIHCSATPPSLDIGADTIRDWHKAKGWSDIGYHYVIKRNGLIELGRDLDGDGDSEDEIGAHAYGFNRDLGVCLIGGINDKGASDANYTLEQYLSLQVLVKDILSRYPDAEVLGHRDLPNVNKDCPCIDIKSLFGG